MAIVQTFESCLESPYLSRDDSAAEQVDDLLAKASDRLETVGKIQENPKGDPTDLCLFSYEAMFYCLRALVYRKGYREAGLRCLLLACEALYVRPGQLDPLHLRNFELAQGLTLAPDEATAAASAFFEQTRGLLRPD